jgi:hypothetical protein
MAALALASGSLNRRAAFAVVARATSSTVSPLTSAILAAASLTNAGSLRLPRTDCGAP